ncbi:MAG: zinc-binding dehydrogenase [Myxococcota bacterium]
MRRIWIPRHGGPEVLEVRTEADPTPGEGEVRIAVRATGVNFADVLARMGLYPDAPPLPCVVGYEVAGVVDAVGPGVTGFAEGQRVVSITRFGGYADRVVAPAVQVQALPDSVPFDVAAGIPVNWLTAWIMLVHLGNVHEGERVLVHAAAGGVGQAAVQIAKWRKAEIIGTASAGKHERLREAGVAHCIDYRTQDFEQEVQRITGGRGVHVALDAVGGASLAKSYRCLAPMGRVFAFGVSSFASGRTRFSSVFSALSGLWAMPTFRPIPMMNANRGVHGINLGHLWDEQERVGAMLREILGLVADGTFAPVLDRTYGFDEAAQAHERLQARENFGKVVLVTE